jgi:hypothetical protein
MAMGLAHALELPGKRRLPKETYLAVQPIYYPGFTVGGMVGEFGGMLTTFVLLLVTPAGTTCFWLTLAAFIALLAMHAAYSLLIHPVNNFWLREVKPGGVGGRFFGFDPIKRHHDAAAPDWMELRDRWENSHLIRAVLGFIALALLVTAVALKP